MLRVEDTDASRVTEEAFHGVLGVAALARPRLGRGPGRRRPHGPYRQSERGRHLPGARPRLTADGPRVSLLLHGRGARRAASRRTRSPQGEAAAATTVAAAGSPTPSARVRERRVGRSRSASPCPSAMDRRRSGQGRGAFPGGPAARLRDRSVRRHAGVPVGRCGRRHADGDHARDPGRRPARERSSQRRGHRGARWNPAALRPSAAGAWAWTASRCRSATARPASRRSASRGSCPRR